MGLIESLGRFFSSMLGLAQGKTERLTDKMLTANAETIRSQFRKTKEDWKKDYQEMRSAIAELVNIREKKLEEAKALSIEKAETQQKMNGAIELYKKNPDERYKAAYAQLAEKMESNHERILILEEEVENQQKSIEHYKARLQDIQKQIDALNKEEAETVADIISSQKIKELNDRLVGLSSDSASKNLDVIREARQKSKAVAKISHELSPANSSDFDKELKLAGSQSAHMAAFDLAIGEGKSTKITEIEVPTLSAPPTTKT